MDIVADVQSSADSRNIAINRVGIKDLSHPIVFRVNSSVHNTVAKLEMTVGLSARVKGAHMSRFLEVINHNYKQISLDKLEHITREMIKILDAEEGTIKFDFPFFVEKQAPVSKKKAFLNYQLTLVCDISSGLFKQSLKLLVPVKSLCPCSKEISDYGAHNQRSHITLTFDSVTADFDILEIIDTVEAQASAPLFALLKRQDEKYVTELAFDNPKFVEDLVRSITLAVEKKSGFKNFFTVESENFESIHNHSAYAIIKRRV